MSKNNSRADSEAAKYITLLFAFIFSLITLYSIYAFVDKTFALILGTGLVIVLIIFFAKKDTMNTVQTTLTLSNENNKSMAEVEKYRQQAQIAHLKALQEALKSDGRVREIEQRQSVKVLDKQPDFDRKLLTVRDDLLLDVDDADFRIVEE